MKSQKLQDAIGRIDPALVARAATLPEQRKKKRPRPYRMIGVAAMLALVILAGHLFGMIPPRGEQGGQEPEKYLPLIDGNKGEMAQLLAGAEYPEMPKFPGNFHFGSPEYAAWDQAIKARRAYFGAGEDLDEFFSDTAEVFLSNTEGENRVYSPLNIYFALAMLAEVSEGESREEILTLLECDNIEALRTKTHTLWNAHYRDDGLVTSLLGSSVWLDRSLAYEERAVEALKNFYYASVYRGEMGSEELDAVLEEWVREQSKGLLTAPDMLSSETLFALVSSIYYKTAWDDKFFEGKNTDGVFHGSRGDGACVFMNMQKTAMYSWGEKFSSASLSLQEGEMVFLLPDEGVSIDECLADAEVRRFLQRNGRWESSVGIKINYSIPKFDVSSEIGLEDGLRQLGVDSCLSAGADFSPLLGENAPLATALAIEHRARVRIDEKGVEGAALTEITAGSAMPPEDEVDFVLDRPFLFLIRSGDGLPLFVGVINQIG